ncbi:MAG: flagellar motor protein MotB [Candidatus Liberibacter ctenarytainae]|uniref:Flagellar motor protein MotB n=1 Tax=Candidatus Liberibacter ctenarytainae TaxID=2020335 RepID=A0A937ACI3_9HYPH|nr:flagellar motor protein MotB [Candidatus Liberibacter ctenarytainae]
MVTSCQLMTAKNLYSIIGQQEDTNASLLSLQKELSSMGNHVFFDANSYSIRSEDVQTLSNLGSWLREHDCDLLIEGFADEQDTGNNGIALGFRRAYSVFDDLVARGIQPSRMKVTSYGNKAPAVFGYDEDSGAKNRRAVVVLRGCR